MPTYEGLRLKALQLDRKLFGSCHQKALENKEFSIISNNCWGGEVYEYYNLRKQSPTAGLFIMADDYIRFLKKLPDYISSELTFISPEKSRWKEWPQVGGDKRFETYPVGLLSTEGEEIELFFLHYRSETEAKQKWERRCERIHWDKLLIKFNDQNGCGETHIQAFLDLDFQHKAFFTCRRWPDLSERMMKDKKVFYREIRQFPESDQIMASYEPFGRSVTRVLNSI